jgi:predicted secreted protein
MAPQGGYGLKVKIDVAGLLTSIAYLESSDFPEMEKVLAEITHHGSTQGYAEWIATGKRKLNEFSMSLFWDIAAPTHAALQAAWESDSPVNFSIADPDEAEVIAFSAHVTKMGRVAEQEEGYRCNISIQPTGVPTITP